MEKIICGYTLHKFPSFFCQNTVLFSKGEEIITVQMMEDALNCILGQVARKNPMIASYKKAKLVFEALKMFLENKTPAHFSKENAKLAIDVLKEIKNESAKSEKEKDTNSQMAFLCKLLLGSFYA